MQPTKKLDVLKEALSEHESKCPAGIDHSCKTVKKEVVADVDSMTKVELINFISMDGDISFFAYGRVIRRTYQHTETEEERDLRVKQEQEVVSKWGDERIRLMRQIEELEQEIAATRPSKAQHFHDQEYIEFLRLKAKMVDKGYPVN